MGALAWWQIEPPTDPSNVNSVLAWGLTLALAAVAWLVLQSRRDDGDRRKETAAAHTQALADRDRICAEQLARKDKTIDDLIAANAQHAETNRALTTAVQAQTGEIVRLHDLLDRESPARRART